MAPKSLTLALLVSLLSTSCSTSLFKVKPATELPPIADDAQTTNAGGVALRVAPFLTDEQTQELFEANLLLLGILPVRVELKFDKEVPKLEKVRPHLRDAAGHEWKRLTPKQAATRIRQASGMSLYNPNAKKQFEQDLGAYGLDLKTPLGSSGGKREGFLFFQTPDKRAVLTNQQLVLSFEKLPQPLSINLR